MALPDFDSLWDYDHPAETGQKFRALLDTAKESGDTSYYAQLLTQIARTQGLQRKFGDAHRTLDEVQSLLKGNLVRGRAHIRCLLERGRAFNSSKHPDQARPLLLEAWEMALKKLKSLQDHIRKDGAIWVVSLNGKRAKIRDVQVIAAAKAAGLVDNKVVAFSETHTALRLVIPVAMR